MIIHDDMPRRDHPLMVDFMQWRRSTMDHGPWPAFSAAHTKYAPRWLPIDEAAKDGWTKFILSETKASHVAYWDGSDWLDPKSNKPIYGKAIGYMPIPDAPEVG